jgi:hypothetical protein
VIQVSGEEAIAPLDSVASVSTSQLRKLAGVSCDHSIEIHLLQVKHSRQIIDARKRQGGLRRLPKPRKHSRPICFDVVLFCTEFTNWRKLVNIPIRQFTYFQRFADGNWIASLTASEDAQKTKREERC